MQLITVPFIINVFIGLLSIAAIVFNGRKNIGSNFYLLGLIVIVLGYQLKAIVVLEGYYDFFPHSIKLFLPFHFLIGPFFYLYARKSLHLEKDGAVRNKDLIHFIPFLVVVLILAPFYIKSGAEKLTLHNAPAPGDFELQDSMIFFYFPILISLVFYCLKSIILINKTNGTSDQRTIRRSIDKVRWLKNFSYVFLFFTFIYLAAQLLFIFTDFRQFFVMLSTVFMSSIFVHFLSFWSLKESYAFAAAPKKHSKHGLSLAQLDMIKEQMLTYLEKEQIFLDSELTSKKFADKLDINTHYLSQIVNQEFNCNLTYLINSHRISHAKEILSNHKFDHLNFHGIASTSGFNSANSFTRVFKKHVGKTPSQFKADMDLSPGQ